MTIDILEKSSLQVTVEHEPDSDLNQAQPYWVGLLDSHCISIHDLTRRMIMLVPGRNIIKLTWSPSVYLRAGYAGLYEGKHDLWPCGISNIINGPQTVHPYQMVQFNWTIFHEGGINTRGWDI